MRCPGLRGRQALAVWNQVENVQQSENELVPPGEQQGPVPTSPGEGQGGEKGN